jgi:hypothetical protein
MSLRVFALACAGLAAASSVGACSHAETDNQANSTLLQFVFTSDAHYGLTRDTFRGRSAVDARTVNQAMVEKINSLPGVKFADDGGLRAGQSVGPVDFLVEGGDVANREEVTGSKAIQRAAVSWSQFRADYIDGLTLTDHGAKRASVYVVPGNHDASNAIGYPRQMVPPVDPTSMVEIFNLMVRPSVPRTTATYRYERDKVLAARDLGGMHLVFLNVWPDSQARAWMERDLEHVSATTPVIIFTHDQPDGEAKQFKNPNGQHDINATDQFENLLSDTLADADGTSTKVQPLVEQQALEGFLRRHRNITAYFHGNSNWNQFYDWTGPGHTLSLHTFRVDSPIKGNVSARDETKLSFQVATLDTAAKTLTVRECLWNSVPSNPVKAVVWGESKTVWLGPRPALPAPPARK